MRWARWARWAFKSRPARRKVQLWRVMSPTIVVVVHHILVVVGVHRSKYHVRAIPPNERLPTCEADAPGAFHPTGPVVDQLPVVFFLQVQKRLEA